MPSDDRLGKLLEYAIRDVPHKVALSSSENEITYFEWFAYCERFSLYLNHLKVRDGKPVGIFLYNSLEYAIAYFSILKTGSIVVPFSPRVKEQELLNELRDTGVCYLIVDQHTSKLINIKAFLENGVEVIFLNLSGEYTHEKRFSKSSPILSEDIACLMPSSGTSSGKPKRIMLSHKGILANVRGHIKHTGLEYVKEVFLNFLPLYFSYSQNTQLLTSLMLRGKLHIMPELVFPHKVIKAIKQYQPTQFNATPTIMRQLCKTNREDLKFPGLKKIFFGGERADRTLKQTIYHTFFDAEIIHTYGLSEAGPRVSSLRGKDFLSKIDSVGTLLPELKVRIRNENGDLVGNNQIGEIEILSPSLMVGYYNMPDLTQEVLYNGWLKTGDLGYMDEEDFLFVVGRKKNLIISGGQNIFPEEIEQYLLTHPSISQILVVPRADEKYGEIIKALIVLKEPGLTELEIKKYCLQELADYKVPKEIEIVEDIKVNYNGKLQRYIYQT